MAVRGATGRQDEMGGGGATVWQCNRRETRRQDEGLEMGEIEKLKCK
jgi:hypothetical protein